MLLALRETQQSTLIYLYLILHAGEHVSTSCFSVQITVNSGGSRWTQDLSTDKKLAKSS